MIQPTSLILVCLLPTPRALEDVDMPPDVLMALLGIKELQSSQDIKEEEW